MYTDIETYDEHKVTQYPFKLSTKVPANAVELEDNGAQMLGHIDHFP
jgi:hypothetical protein